MVHLIVFLNEFLELPVGLSTIYVYSKSSAKPQLGLKAHKQSPELFQITIDNFVTGSNVSIEYPRDIDSTKQGAVTEFFRWFNMLSQQDDSILFIEQTRKSYKTKKGHWIPVPTQSMKTVTQV